ncbi:hypothetical protein ACFLRC_01695 [Candidatus Altiarchaeota archaeon]
MSKLMERPGPNQTQQFPGLFEGQQRRIQPLEVAPQEEWESALAEGKFAFRQAGKTLSIEQKTRLGDFQGAYQMRDGRMIVFRSVYGVDRINVTQIDTNSSDPEYLLIGHFESLGAGDGIADIHNRLIFDKDFRGHGIATVAFDKLEPHLSSNDFKAVNVEAKPDDFKSFIMDRGYKPKKNNENPGEEVYELKLPKASQEDDMHHFHKFPVSIHGDRTNVVLPIK